MEGIIIRKGSFYSINDYIITRNGEIINKHNNRKIKPQPNGKGYLRVIIGHKKYFVHRLVAQKYIPNPENKLQVNHKDGNKLNNCVSNLEWVTNQENRTHAVINGLHLSGEMCSWAKLTQADALFIKNDTFHSITDLAKMFNVSKATIRDIKTERTWKQLKRYADLSQNEVIEIKDKKPL